MAESNDRNRCSVAFSRVYAMATWRTGDERARERSYLSITPVGYFWKHGCRKHYRTRDVSLQHQPPHQILVKADPSGVPMVLLPDTRLSISKEDESLDEGGQRAKASRKRFSRYECKLTCSTVVEKGSEDRSSQGT